MSVDLRYQRTTSSPARKQSDKTFKIPQMFSGTMRTGVCSKTLTLPVALGMAIAGPDTTSSDPTSALVYRDKSGKTACQGCPESISDLLVAAFPNIDVTFAGPTEDVQVNAETLSHVDILAQPGGPGRWNNLTTRSCHV